MKNIYFISFFLGTCLIAKSQNSVDSSTIDRPYKKWSIEIGIGQNKPVRPFSSGYYSSNPNRYFNFGDIVHYDLGIRYMFNTKFGLKADFAFDRIMDQSNSGSLIFDSRQYRVGVQGVVNLSRVLNFESFTNRFGILAHAGLQIGKFTPQMGPNKDKTEDNGGVIFGVSPQFKITNWLVLHGDFTVINNVRQHFNWDGSYSAVDNNLSGLMYTTSIGFTIYPGKQKIHADWHYEGSNKTKTTVDKDARDRLDKVESMLNDVDRDGVPDYLDVENNTPAGVAVDTRGRIIDINRNGIPDELEKSVKDGQNGLNSSLQTKDDAIRSLIEKGFVNVFYDLNKDIPNSGSTNNVYYIIQFLKRYPDAKAKLVGYADINGKEDLNKDLSKRRAQKLFEIITMSGINPERLSIQAEGVDKTFDNTSSVGLQLARRVSIILE